MGIGVGIFLIVVGAILTFAVDATIAGLDLDVVGWILMLAGTAGLVLFLYFSHRNRTPRTVMTERRVYDDTGQQVEYTPAEPIGGPPRTYWSRTAKFGARLRRNG